MPRVTKAGNAVILENQYVDILGQAIDYLRDTPDMPPICDFVESKSFLDHKLYPRQRAILKLIFLEVDNMTDYEKNVINDWAEGFSPTGVRIGISPDIWSRVQWMKDRNYPHFHEVINISGRRGGKGYLGALIAAYSTFKMIKLDDPQGYYGIDRDKDLYLYCSASNLKQATSQQFADIANIMIGAPCFQRHLDASSGESFIALRTPADVRKIAQLESQGIRLNRRIASIRIEPISTSAGSSRGAACYGTIFDEMAWMDAVQGPGTSQKIYEAITPALDQFGKDSIIYIPTTPSTKVGKAYSLYEQALQEDYASQPLYPNMLMVQLPSWEMYEDWQDLSIAKHTFTSAPMEYNEEMKLLEQRDPQTFLTERQAQWSDVIDAYLDSNQVERMFQPFWDGNINKVLAPVEVGILKNLYYCHIDPSASQANFAMAIAHCEQIPDEYGEGWYHVYIDYMKVWKPEQFEDHQVDYGLIENELVEKFRHFASLEKVSYDQYGAFVTVYRMKERLREAHHSARVLKKDFTAKSNAEMYEKFKAALGMGWVHAYKDSFGMNNTSLLESELKFLTRTGSKIDHPHSGLVQTDDLADCVLTCVSELLEDNFRRLALRKRLGETKLLVGAQGGYSTKNSEPGLDPLNKRQQLNDFSRNMRFGQQQHGYENMERSRQQQRQRRRGNR